MCLNVLIVFDYILLYSYFHYISTSSCNNATAYNICSHQLGHCGHMTFDHFQNKIILFQTCISVVVCYNKYKTGDINSKLIVLIWGVGDSHIWSEGLHYLPLVLETENVNIKHDV